MMSLVTACRVQMVESPVLNLNIAWMRFFTSDTSLFGGDVTSVTLCRGCWSLVTMLTFTKEGWSLGIMLTLSREGWSLVTMVS